MGPIVRRSKGGVGAIAILVIATSWAPTRAGASATVVLAAERLVGVKADRPSTTINHRPSQGPSHKPLHLSGRPLVIFTRTVICWSCVRGSGQHKRSSAGHALKRYRNISGHPLDMCIHDVAANRCCMFNVICQREVAGCWRGVGEVVAG